MAMMHQPNDATDNHSLTCIADVAYVTAVLLLYTGLPDTPRRASPYDRTVARSLFKKTVPLDVVEAAMLLGSLRRWIRPPGALPLPRIGSLAYFSPVVDELQERPLPAGYLDYLRRKAHQIFPPTAASRDRSPQ